MLDGAALPFDAGSGTTASSDWANRRGGRATNRPSPTVAAHVPRTRTTRPTSASRASWWSSPGTSRKASPACVCNPASA